MGIIKRGILGGFSGSVANVVGSSWKGIATMRSKPLSVANPKSAGQVAQRSKFSFAVMIAGILLVPFIKPFWDRFAVKMSGYNSFIKTNIAKFGDWSTTVWSDIMLSVGKIGATPITSVDALANNNEVAISFSNDAGSENKLATDPVYAVVFNETQETISFPNAERTRSQELISVISDNDLVAGDVLHIYLCFRRADGSMVSNSYYANHVVTA